MSKKRLPPLNWLRSFEASARHLNFTLAATELNLTQAAISQQVKGLETQLGATLFKRLPRGLELTDAGKSYLPPVRDAIERLAAVTDEIFGQGVAKAVTVKVNLVFFTHWLAPRLHRFYALHPDVRLNFPSSIWIEERKWDSDLDIRHGLGNWQGLTSERLTWDHLVPVCGHNVNGKAPPAHIGQLAEYTLLHVAGYKEGWGYWLSQSGNDDLVIASHVHFDTLISALQMASLGHGIALGRTSLISNLLQSQLLIAPFAEQFATQEAFYLVYPSQHSISHNAEKFRAWLVQEAMDAHLNS